MGLISRLQRMDSLGLGLFCKSLRGGQHGTDAFLPFRSEKDCVNCILLSERRRGGGLSWWRIATVRCAFSEWRPKRRVTWTSSMTDPFSFGEPSTLHMRMGWGSGVVSSWCFCTKLRFMNIPVALESRSMDMETDVREVREGSSTWMLRERGECFDRT